MQNDVSDEEPCYLGGTAFLQGFHLGVAHEVVSSYDDLLVPGIQRR